MIAIVGAGLTGLALAHELAKLGVEHVVLEASGRPGGVIRSGRVQGHLLEWGPQRGRMTQALAELVRELGIENQVVNAPPGLPLFVYRRGKLRPVPFSPGAFVRSNILSWPGKLRLLAEPLTAGPRPDERVADFFVRKAGQEAYDNIIGPLYGGLYASDPKDMVLSLSLGHVLNEFGVGRSLLLALARRGGSITPPAACSFAEGMQTLPDALYARHQGVVRLSTPVRRLHPDGAGWALETEGETIRARHVVLTAAAGATADLLAEAVPDAAARVRTLVYNPLAVVHVHAETDLWGLGYQVSLAEKMATRGVTWNDALFGRKGVYTCYLGGAKRPDVVDLPDDALAELALREYRQATGFDARPLSIARERMPAWDRSWAALQGMRLPEGVHVAANWESRPGIPGRLLQARRLAKKVAGVPPSRADQPDLADVEVAD